MADRCGRPEVYTGVLAVYGSGTAGLCLVSASTPVAVWMVYAALCGACTGALMALTGPVAVEMVQQGEVDARAVPVATSKT